MSELCKADTRKELERAMNGLTYETFLSGCDIVESDIGKFAAQISCARRSIPITRQWENRIRTEVLGMEPRGRRKRWRPAVPLWMADEFENYAEVEAALNIYLDNRRKQRE